MRSQVAVFASALLVAGTLPSGALAAPREPEGAAAAPATFKTLFELLIQTAPDAFQSDAYAKLYKSVSHRKNDLECRRAAARLKDPATAQDVLAEARRSLEKAANAAKGREPRRTLTMSIFVQLDQDQRADGSFPINAYASGRGRPGESGFFVGGGRVMAYSFVMTDYCILTGWPRDVGGLTPLTSVGVTVSGGEALKSVKMDAGEAASRIARAERGEPNALLVRIDAEVDVTATARGLAGRLISADAVDPQSERLLYRYPASLFQPEPRDELATPTADAAPEPATNNAVAFAILKARPEFLGEQDLLTLTKRQLESDKAAYRAVRQTGQPRQGLIVFEPTDVEGVSVEFAAPLLAPKLRAVIERAAASAPTRMWTGTRIGSFRYDHARSMLLLDCCSIRASRMPGRFDLLSLPSYFEHGVNLARAKPPAGAGAPDARLAERASYSAGAPGEEKAKAPRDRYAYLLPPIPRNVVLSLDRVLELEGVPVEPKKMNAAMLALESRGRPDGFYTRVEFTVEGVVDGPDARWVHLLGRVDRVEIRYADDRVLAVIDLATLPLARERKQELDAASQAISATAR